MAKEFNTAVTCNPKNHYMVDVSQKMNGLRDLIDKKKYFTINRARQFGKSTALNWIARNLKDKYYVIPISFEKVGGAGYKDEKTFVRTFCGLVSSKLELAIQDFDTQKIWDDQMATADTFDGLSDSIVRFCRQITKPVVLTIDEVDKSLDNQLFLNLLGMFRNLYLERNETGDDHYTFWSVILAGVYDVKNLKVKIRPDEERKYNSPWNVAADFTVDMTFNPLEISTMLADYENEHHIGFDIIEISNEIYKYTSGYPVLVSSVCKKIDEVLDKDWSKEGVQKAARLIIKEKSTLTDDIVKNLEIYPDVKKFLRAILLENFSIAFNINNPTMNFANMFSIIKESPSGKAEIHNLIFQQVLYNYFISENELRHLFTNSGLSVYTDKNGDLNMPVVMERFALTVKKFHTDKKFLEEQGRLIFLCFLKPIINGTGFYYVEPENDDSSRMDIVVNYNRKEYVIELKLWYGEKYELSGRDQLSEYLAARKLDTGYLITFSFLKEKKLQDEPEWIHHNGMRILETVIDCGATS